jgi:hypothetical protein
MSTQRQRPRFCGDFSEDEYLQSMDTFLNGAFYPKHGVFIARASRLTEQETGRYGELVSITPFYLACRVPSLVPDGSESKIIEDRGDKKGSGIFCFPLRIDAGSGEHLQHNALAALSTKARASYLSPLFIRRRNLSVLKGGPAAGTAVEEEPARKTAKIGAAILRESAVIVPHAAVEKNDALRYYSFTRAGEIAFHGDKIERPAQKLFLAHDFIMSLLDDRNEAMTAGEWTAALFEMMPDIFGLSANARKLKYVLEATIAEHIDESEFSTHPSVNKMLDALSVYEELVIIEKLLRTHFGITQYLRIAFRN